MTTENGPETGPETGSETGTSTPTADRPSRGWLRENSELGVSLLLLVIGALVLTDALTMDVAVAQRGPIGPKTVPIVVGIGLLIVAVLLAIDVLRGGRGEAETGEDIDLSEPSDWRTVLFLAGVFLGFAVLIGPLGFPIAGALLFWGASFALGSRHLDRDPLIAAGLSLFTYFVFNNLLGVPLPGGPLMGVL